MLAIFITELGLILRKLRPIRRDWKQLICYFKRGLGTTIILHFLNQSKSSLILSLFLVDLLKAEVAKVENSVKKVKIKDTDSDYVKLAKAGGHSSRFLNFSHLLTHSFKPKQSASKMDLLAHKWRQMTRVLNT